jgi:hypothetical protein
MSNLSHRLRKLERPPERQAFIDDACLRLFRYGIETRHLVRTGKIIELAWGPAEEAIYQDWKKDPDFDAFEREILANPSYSGDVNAR